MNKFMILGVVLTSSFALAACQANVTTSTTNTATPATAANTAAPAAPAAPASNASAPLGGAAPTATTSGDATNQNFTLNNQSSRTITHVYVSPVTSEQWGPDVLGTSVIPAGGNAQITFPRAETQCNWDVRVTIDGSENHELRNQNLCTTTELNYSE